VGLVHDERGARDARRPAGPSRERLALAGENGTHCRFAGAHGPIFARPRAPRQRSGGPPPGFTPAGGGA
jgi:hypothetical protein